jgi:hypothetical protein
MRPIDVPFQADGTRFAAATDASPEPGAPMTGIGAAMTAAVSRDAPTSIERALRNTPLTIRGDEARHQGETQNAGRLPCRQPPQLAGPIRAETGRAGPGDTRRSG